MIATAEGDASRFRQIFTEYAKAPQVTRDRMYLETMQQVFANTTKVYVDSRNSTLLSLPLERLLQSASPDAARPTPAPVAPAPAAEAPAEPNRAREGLRSRDRDASR